MSSRCRRSLLGVVVGFLSAFAPAAACAPLPSSVPIQVPINLFGNNGPNIVPPSDSLTPAEEQRFLAYARQPTLFPRYIYSGCHNRAHAAYLLLPAELKPKVMKIWLVSPGVYSAGFVGLIGLKGQEPGYQEVAWGYHVALAYRDPNGTVRVLDVALKPGQPLSETEWFGLLKIPLLTYWTLTHAEVYQFTSVPTNLDTGNRPLNPAVWTGNYFRDFGGKGLGRNRFVEELARDVIGEEALAGRVCPSLALLVKKPDDLQNRLRDPVIPGCEATFQRYESEKARWMKALYGSP